LKKLILVLFALFTILSLFGCSYNQNNVDSVVASEKKLPLNFHEIAVKREEPPYYQYLVEKAENQTQYKEVWEFFGLTQRIPEVNFDEKNVFFIGVHESGSCTLNISDIKIDVKNQVMTILFAEKSGDCTADATPRTFVIKVNKEQSKSLKKVIFVERGTETPVQIDEK
jgi:hypothetical protein